MSSCRSTSPNCQVLWKKVSFSPQDVQRNLEPNDRRAEFFHIPIPGAITLARGVPLSVGHRWCGEIELGVRAESPKHNKTEDMCTSAQVGDCDSLSFFLYLPQDPGLILKEIQTSKPFKTQLSGYEWTRITYVCMLLLHSSTLFCCSVRLLWHCFFLLQFVYSVFFPFYAIFLKWGILEYIFKILLLRTNLICHFRCYL